MVEEVKVIATNRKAGFEYFLLERFEAGLSLQGSEIKSIRNGQMSIAESFVDIENGRDAFLVEAHIAPYEQANRFNHDPKRKRRLLLHKKEIRELWNGVRLKGMTIVPTRVYLKMAAPRSKSLWRAARNYMISARRLRSAMQSAKLSRKHVKESDL